MFQGHDRPQTTGVAVSVLMHGALAAAVAYQLAAGAGSPAPARRTTTMNVHLVASPVARTSPPEPTVPSTQVAPDAVAAGEPMLTSAAAVQPAPAGALAGGAMTGNPAPAAGGLAVNAGEARSNYQARLRDHLVGFFTYPEAASMARLSGRVELHLVVGRAGGVSSAWIQRSSGHDVLDAAALDLLRRAQPLPALPSDLPDQLEISLPLDYAAARLVLGGS